MASWLVIGGSPSGRLWLDSARSRAWEQMIATNSGIRVALDAGLVPDWVWLSDQVACDRYHEDLEEARAGGARLATASREPSALAARRLAHADQVVRVHEPEGQVPRHVAGQVTQARFSGLLALEFALFWQADVVGLLGMDGYRSTPRCRVVDTADGQIGKPEARAQTLEWIEPWLKSIAAVRPDVQVLVYGRPVWLVPSRWQLAQMEERRGLGRN